MPLRVSRAESDLQVLTYDILEPYELPPELALLALR